MSKEEKIVFLDFWMALSAWLRRCYWKHTKCDLEERAQIHARLPPHFHRNCCTKVTLVKRSISFSVLSKRAINKKVGTHLANVREVKAAVVDADVDRHQWEGPRLAFQVLSRVPARPFVRPACHGAIKVLRSPFAARHLLLRRSTRAANTGAKGAHYMLCCYCVLLCATASELRGPAPVCAPITHTGCRCSRSVSKQPCLNKGWLWMSGTKWVRSECRARARSRCRCRCVTQHLAAYVYVRTRWPRRQ